MKRIFIPTLIMIAALLLASCAGAAAPETTTSASSDAYVSQVLDASYENALSIRLQLTLGSLKLAETATPLTPDQAKVMLPLWNGLVNMSSTGNSAPAEVNALLAQIEASFTPNQLAAIREMKLVSTDLQSWAAANGVTLGSGTGQGTGQGGGSSLSPEARATRQAAEGVTSGQSGSTGASTALVNFLIAYLEGLAQ